MDTVTLKQEKADLEKRVKQLESEIEATQSNFDEYTLDLALSISELFEVLRKLTNGDFAVRANEDYENELIANFGRVINETIENLGREKQQLEESNLKLEEHAKELERSMDTIKRQRTAIAEMSTPIIQVWDGVLCLPVVGIVDSRRAADMMEVLLENIVEKKCQCVIVDITGVDVVDTQAADHFIKMVRAANLLGTNCMITGISPQIAQTLTHIGVDLTGIKTMRNLQAGLEESFKKMELTVSQGGYQEGANNCHVLK